MRPITLEDLKDHIKGFTGGGGMCTSVWNPKHKKNERDAGDKARYPKRGQSIEDWWKEPTPSRKGGKKKK